jgi:hypothetical protein
MIRGLMVSFSSAGSGETSDLFTKLLKRSFCSAIGCKRCFPGVSDDGSGTQRASELQKAEGTQLFFGEGKCD